MSFMDVRVQVSYSLPLLSYCAEINTEYTYKKGGIVGTGAVPKVTTIQIHKGTRIFILEDSEERINWFAAVFKPSLDFALARTSDEAVTLLTNYPPFDMFFLDHDLGPEDYKGYHEGYTRSYGNGQEVAKYLKDNDLIKKYAKVVVHSWNTTGAAKMKDIIISNVALIPFGSFQIQIIEQEWN